MGYLLVSAACVVLSVTLHPATATSDCDLYATVQEGYTKCLQTNYKSLADAGGIEAMRDKCSKSDASFQCVFDRFLPCDDGTIWLEMVRSRSWCNNYRLADWATEDLFPSDPMAIYGCLSNIMMNITACTQQVEATYASTMGAEDQSLKDGLKQIKKIKNSFLQCGKAEIRTAFQAQNSPECASYTWQQLYNFFVVTITVSVSPPLGVNLQQGDLIPAQVGNGQPQSKRAGMAIPWLNNPLFRD